MADQTALKNHLWDGAVEAFETMISLPIEPQTDQTSFNETQSFIGSITFTGPLEGALLVQCEAKSAQKIAKSMLMMEDEEEIDDAEINDALGEVVNLVLGGFKSRIADSIGDIDISVPTVIKGKKVKPSVGAASEKIEAFGKGDDCQVKFEVVYKEG